MRINSHTHIFTLKSVFTSKTIDILTRRITSIDFPVLMKEKMTDLLDKTVSEPISEVEVAQLTEAFIQDVQSNLFSLSGSWDLELDFDKHNRSKQSEAEIFPLLAGKLQRFLDIHNQDARHQQTIFDIINYIVIGLMPGIDDVADHLISKLAPDDAAVVLMMDVTVGGKNDEDLFIKQIADTSNQVLRHPGRILPFIAVNPLRVNHLDFMDTALRHQGFVGVKLYPSLGYSIEEESTQKVIKYCHDQKVPILVHCMEDGFNATKTSCQNSAPGLWANTLKTYPGLRLCFGHFGGSHNLIQPEIPSGSWTQDILNLMKEEFNTGVYADISFHPGPMAHRNESQAYISKLKELLHDPDVGGRILFGSDFWMVRTALSEKSYWDYYEENLGTDLFEQMAATNPAKFLGIGSGAVLHENNIKNYLNFMTTNLPDEQLQRGAVWLQG